MRRRIQAAVVSPPLLYRRRWNMRSACRPSTSSGRQGLEWYIELLPAQQVFDGRYALLIASSLAIDLCADPSVIPLTVAVLGSTRSVAIEERDLLGASFLWILRRLDGGGHLRSGRHYQVRGHESGQHPGRRVDSRTGDRVSGARALALSDCVFSFVRQLSSDIRN